MPLRKHKDNLDRLYAKLNRRDLVSPDPLQFLYDYADPQDREIIAVPASSLAYGRVRQILASVAKILDRLGPAPKKFLRDATQRQLAKTFADFRHRFHGGEEMAALLWGVRNAIVKHGSLQRAFAKCIPGHDAPAAMSAFVQMLAEPSGWRCGTLLCDPADGSACKRLHMFMRWMVRRDEVDPGGWNSIPAAMLIVPIDTHMHRLAGRLGATNRKSADGRTAHEVTAAFAKIAPDDPVKYDFALTRLGIRDDLDADAIARELGLDALARPKTKTKPTGKRGRK